MTKDKNNDKPSVVLSLLQRNKEELMAAVTSDTKELANGICSFLMMCSNGQVKEISDEHARAVIAGVGQWMMDLPIDESAEILKFLTACIEESMKVMTKNKKCDC